MRIELGEFTDVPAKPGRYAGSRWVALSTLRTHRRASGASHQATQLDGQRCPAKSDRSLRWMPPRLASAKAVARKLALTLPDPACESC